MDKTANDPAAEPAERIDNGQRVAAETRFVQGGGQAERIRFTHPLDRPLPPDENLGPLDPEALARDSSNTAAVGMTPSASVWEAREGGDEGEGTGETSRSKA